MKKGHSSYYGFFISMKQIFIICIVLFIFGCTQKEQAVPVEYEGPLQEAQEIELLYTQQEHVKVKMTAALLYEFKSGDRDFPKGLYLEFFNEQGVLASTLKANHAYFFKSENKWRARGKVQVVNQEKNEQLNTEELFWYPQKEWIATESFVTIRLQSEVIYGEGLEAKQDMSTYRIKDPQGEFHFDENMSEESLQETPKQQKEAPTTKKQPRKRFSEETRPKPSDKQ
jgi:LPS export ABC transporter protein LptC